MYYVKLDSNTPKNRGLSAVRMVIRVKQGKTTILLALLRVFFINVIAMMRESFTCAVFVPDSCHVKSVPIHCSEGNYFIRMYATFLE